jgi:hypothetical protein
MSSSAEPKDPRLLLQLPFLLSFPKGICFCPFIHKPTHSSTLQKLRPVLTRQRPSLRPELRLSFIIQHRRRSSPRLHHHPNSRKKLLLPRRSTDTQQPNRRITSIAKLVRSVRRNMHRRPSLHHRTLAAKVSLQLALQHNETLLEIMPMRRRPTTRRNMHINQTKPPRRILPRQQNRVSVPHQSYVRQLRIIRLHNHQPPRQIIRRNPSTALIQNSRIIAHRSPPHRPKLATRVPGAPTPPPYHP